MRKIFFTMLSALLVFFLSGCGNSQKEEKMEIESIHEDSEESTMQQSAQNSNMDNSRDARQGILWRD